MSSQPSQSVPNRHGPVPVRRLSQDRSGRGPTDDMDKRGESNVLIIEPRTNRHDDGTIDRRRNAAVIVRVCQSRIDGVTDGREVGITRSRSIRRRRVQSAAIGIDKDDSPTGR